MSAPTTLQSTRSARPSAQPVFVYIYWDHSNIFIEAQHIADEKESEQLGADVGRRVRLDFQNLLLLAHENRPIAKAVAAGSVPPEMKTVWEKLELAGVHTEIFARSLMGGSERNVPDLYLQREMLRDGFRSTDPGTVILLTGDGAGYYLGKGFLDTLESFTMAGWTVELLSWERSCNGRLRQWVAQHGLFTCLDDFYESITYVKEPSEGKVGKGRKSTPVDLWKKRARPFERRPQN